MDGELERERTHAFDLRLHVEEHATHVGVLDDRHARRRRVLEVLDRCALLTILRVLERIHVRRARDGDPLDADRDARAVHHEEHLRHALVQLGVTTDGITDAGLGLTEVEDAGRRSVDAHLVLDVADVHVVGRTERAVGVRPHARHDEERQALRAGGGAIHAREHEVDDVLREIVIAAGDEDLGAGDGVATVAQRLGPRASGAHVGAGLRLGEAHRAAPLAGVHAREVMLALLRGAEVLDDLGGPERQPRVHGERRVRARQHLLHQHHDRLRCARAAELLARADSLPAGGEELVPCLLEAGRRLHATVLDPTALGIGARVQRTDDVLDPLVAFVD